MSEPMKLPENYNPETHLLSKTTENGKFHESRGGTSFARRLMANGHPDDIALAHKVLEATLACQETMESDPHYGNFYWMAEDDTVGDLNAVEFCLESLIPMMTDNADKLKPEMRERVFHAIRLGLGEIARLDVRVSYSNITMLDILNTCLGGELLADDTIAKRGYDKLNDWIAFTDRSGTPREYNSPTYTRVCVSALGILSRYLKDETSRVRAKAFAARIGITIGLHIHPATGRWAGPHSRAYHPTVICEGPAEVLAVRDWIEGGALEKWVDRLIDPDQVPYEVRETASIDEHATLSTYMSDSYSLGVTSIGYGGQSNTILSHFVRQGADRPGVFFSRYLTNDKWLGDFYHATDRTMSRNLMDEGQFCGVQSGSRAIALYAPRNLGVISSAKSSYVWTERDKIDEILIGENKVESLPADVLTGKIVTVASGDALFAILPLSRTDIGRDAPMKLVERAGDLVLDIYNYSGTEKSFWEYRGADGPFFQGHPKNGVYVEVAERNDYADTAAFSRVVASGAIEDRSDDPFVSDGSTQRLWTIEYERDDEKVGIEVDLMSWTVPRRWTETGDLGYPMLDSPFAAQSQDGTIHLARATVEASGGPVWMVAPAHTEEWIVGYHGPNPISITLTIPGGGKVHVPQISAGTIHWQDGNIKIDGGGLVGEPSTVGGTIIT